MVTVRFVWDEGADRSLGLPSYESAGAAGADLRNADLHGLHLHGRTLTGADLTGANLETTNLPGADLSGAILRDATLNGTHLEDALLVRTDDGDLLHALELHLCALLAGLVIDPRSDVALTGLDQLIGAVGRAEFREVGRQDGAGQQQKATEQQAAEQQGHVSSLR